MGNHSVALRDTRFICGQNDQTLGRTGRFQCRSDGDVKEHMGALLDANFICNRQDLTILVSQGQSICQWSAYVENDARISSDTTEYRRVVSTVWIMRGKGAADKIK